MMIAKKAGFPEKAAEAIYNIGLLHDIGKITVPDEILNKKGRLDDEEFSVIKKHTSNGSEILKEIAIAPNSGRHPDTDRPGSDHTERRERLSA